MSPVVNISGVAAGTSAGTVKVSAAMAWHVTWVDCAIERYLAARTEREGLHKSQAPGQPIYREFLASTLVITSCAFALEALAQELKAVVMDPTLKAIWNPRKGEKKPPAYERIFQTLDRAGALPNSAITDLTTIFRLRNLSKRVQLRPADRGRVVLGDTGHIHGSSAAVDLDRGW